MLYEVITYDDIPYLEMVLSGEDPLDARVGEAWESGAPDPSSMTWQSFFRSSAWGRPFGVWATMSSYVITSYSIHYTKLYETTSARSARAASTARVAS